MSQSIGFGKVLLLFFLQFCILKIYFVYNEKSPDPLSIFSNVKFVDNNINEAVQRKYLTATYAHPAGLGNVLFRLAALYGIGKTIDRYPYVNAAIDAYTTQLDGLTELSLNFPLLHEYIEIKVPDKSLVKTVDFSDECCIFEDPKRLQEFNEIKYLKLSANYLQSYKFFDFYQDDIKRLMECSVGNKEQAQILAKKIWKRNPNTHKFCIHTRREDFIPYWPLESRYEFIVPAAQYVFDQLKDKFDDISLFVFGDSAEFVNDLVIPRTRFASVDNLVNGNLSRGLEMCFAIENCDTFLLSASASTFGWWMAYLKKSPGDVYYNAVVTKVDYHVKTTHDYDIFPPNWKKLLLHDNMTVTEETKWSLERNYTGYVYKYDHIIL